MNERIKELLAQSGLQPYYNAQGHIEKFAELLLDEFIEALDKYNGHHSEMSDYGLSILIGYIRIHFGMEEKNE